MSESIKRREQACLDLLKATKTDNEKLAGLLLVPKLFSTTIKDESDGVHVKADVETTEAETTLSLDKQFQRDLITAIDFKFLRRMLSGVGGTLDPDTSQSVDAASLKAAALSVILCFTDTEVLTDNQISQVVGNIESILTLPPVSSAGESEAAGPSESSEDNNQLHSLCAQCLENFVRDQDSRVVEEILLPAIYRIASKQTTESGYI